MKSCVMYYKKVSSKLNTRDSWPVLMKISTVVSGTRVNIMLKMLWLCQLRITGSFLYFFLNDWTLELTGKMWKTARW